MSDQRPFLERRQSTRPVDSTLQTVSWLRVCVTCYIPYFICHPYDSWFTAGGVLSQSPRFVVWSAREGIFNQAQMHKMKSHAVMHVIIVVVVAIVVPPVASLGQGSRRGD